MAKQTTGKQDTWQGELSEWLEPFLARFRRKAHRRWAPLYLMGLLGPVERKNVESIASFVAPAELQQLHHFVSTSPWDADPLEEELAWRVDELVGGEDAHLIIDDTSIVKKGRLSVGVHHQYCGELGKQANCQSLVSVTLARDEVPIVLGLRLYMPRSWTDDPERCLRAKVPEWVEFRPKWRIALEEIDRLLVAGVRFGDVLADGGYGMCAAFRAGLTERGLKWAVGIPYHQKVFAEDVQLIAPQRARSGRPQRNPRPSEPSCSAEQMIAALGDNVFKDITWRIGTKGALHAEFAAVRIRVADGRPYFNGLHLPGDAAWLICERRSGGELRYYLSNYPQATSLKRLAQVIKARWSCEQAHQQLKQELGLDHFEGRSYSGLHHHALLTMIAMAFLQAQRFKEKKRRPPRTAAITIAPDDSETHLVGTPELNVPSLQRQTLDQTA